MLTNQFTPAALEWGLGEDGSPDCSWEPPGMPCGGVAASAAVGGTALVGV